MKRQFVSALLSSICALNLIGCGGGGGGGSNPDVPNDPPVDPPVSTETKLSAGDTAFPLQTSLVNEGDYVTALWLDSGSAQGVYARRLPNPGLTTSVWAKRCASIPRAAPSP